MDEEKMLKQIHNQQRDLPEGFEQRMEDRLHHIIQTKRHAKLSRTKHLKLAVALIVFMAVGAFALQQSGLLNFREPYMKEEYYFLLPAAQELVHPLHAAASFDGWKAELREVLFDGRWLKLVYAVTDQDANEPFTRQQKESIENGDLDSLYQLYSIADAYPTTETSGSLLINGKQINIHSAATGAGDNPGEYLIVVDSELELSAQASQGHPYLRPVGETELTLPFMNSQGIQVVALSAHFDAGDVVHRYAGTLPEPVRLEIGQLVFYDLFISPANTVIEYGIIFPPQSEEMAEALPAVQLVNKEGNPIGTGKDSHYSILEHQDGTKEIRYHITNTPSEHSGEVFLLLPDGAMIPVESE